MGQNLRVKHFFVLRPGNNSKEVLKQGQALVDAFRESADDRHYSLCWDDLSVVIKR